MFRYQSNENVLGTKELLVFIKSVKKGDGEGRARICSANISINHLTLSDIIANTFCNMLKNVNTNLLHLNVHPLVLVSLKLWMRKFSVLESRKKLKRFKFGDMMATLLFPRLYPFFRESNMWLVISVYAKVRRCYMFLKRNNLMEHICLMTI